MVIQSHGGVEVLAPALQFVDHLEEVAWELLKTETRSTDLNAALYFGLAAVSAAGGALIVAQASGAVSLFGCCSSGGKAGKCEAPPPACEGGE
mmetsp:Transcript_9044/g.20109  ORF Transcript_9044/g.20109 Transcript_9044/m.20109 type:complete len:93 (+) Transcript_9044:125-403(+)